MIYFDTSALIKLVTPELESAALREWLGDRSDRMVTSDLTSVELMRAAARVGSSVSTAAIRLLARIDRLALAGPVLSMAAILPPPELRSLGAIHIASAASLADLETLVTYDQRMAAAARDYGLPVTSPS